MVEEKPQAGEEDPAPVQAQAVPPPPAGLVVVRGGGGGGGHDFEGGCGGSGCCCLWVVGGWVGGWSRACCGHSACACSCSAEGCPTTVQIERQGVGPARGLDTRVAAQHKERRVPCGVGGWVVARRGRGWARAQHTHTGCSGGAPPHTQIFRGLGPFGRPKTRGAKGEGAHPHARVAGSAGRGLRCAKGGVGGGGAQSWRHDLRVVRELRVITPWPTCCCPSLALAHTHTRGHIHKAPGPGTICPPPEAGQRNARAMTKEGASSRSNLCLSGGRAPHDECRRGM